MAISYSHLIPQFGSPLEPLKSPFSPTLNPSSNSAISSLAFVPDTAFRSTLSPEAEFVLLGARTQLDGSRLECWEKLLLGEGQCAHSETLRDKDKAHALDWHKVLSLADAHRVVGLLGRHLSARGWKNVPAWVVRDLKTYFARATLRSAALQTELAQVCRQLESAGIPVVSFKGPTLALAAYGNAVVRPSADLDLLVARSDALRAREVLRQSGYVPEVEFSSDQANINLRVDSVFNLFRAVPAPLSPYFASGYAVELHWAITSPCLPFDLHFESVKPRLSWLQLPGVGEGAQVRALAAEDLLLILCVHGAKHLWERLIWLCDVAQLLGATPELDWPTVLRAAKTRGVERMTALGLVLTRDMLGTPLPREVENWLSTQPQALRLAAQIRPSLLDESNLTGQLAGHLLSADKLLMQTIDRPRHRVGFLWHLATTPTMSERAAVDLPPGLDFLWCVLRPARAIQKRLLPPASHAPSP